METHEAEKFIGNIIKNYIITKYINHGSFGMVFEAQEITTKKLVALKIPINNDIKKGQRCLIEEAKVYKKLNGGDGIANVDTIKNNGVEIIVMDLLGLSLENLLSNSKYKKFRLKSIIMLSIQLIENMKYIHSCGYLHRDIKPDNFVIGYNNKNKIYCIDFGIAKKYIKKNNQHIEFRTNLKFCGTARYASIASHLGQEQSRKDDLESIGYLIIYLFRGSLPWSGIRHKDKNEKYRLICEKKRALNEEELCKELPKEFLVYLKYVRNMDFNEKPHYTSLINMFQKLYDSKGYHNNNFEWSS